MLIDILEFTYHLNVLQHNDMFLITHLWLFCEKKR